MGKRCDQSGLIMVPLYFQGTTVAEEEDDPILLKHKRNRSKVIEQETKVEPQTIKKLNVSFAHLQAVSY